MSTLMQGVDRLREQGQAAPGGSISVRDLLRRSPTSPRGSVRALLARLLVGGGGIGRWFVGEESRGIPLEAEAFAVHAALLRTGKILYFSGSRFDAAALEDPRLVPARVDNTSLFDCDAMTIQRIDSPTSDTFCSGHAFLDDGRLLVAGGTAAYPPPDQDPHSHFLGTRDAWLFDPAPGPGRKHWSPTAKMLAGRWYPTLVTLRDGRVLALSGLHEPVSDPGVPHTNQRIEVYSAATGAWQHTGDSSEIAPGGYLYPRLHVLPGGDVFSATPVQGGQSARWTPSSAPFCKELTPAPDGYWWFFFTSVLLPFLPEDSYRFRVAVFGLGEAPEPPPPDDPPRGAAQGHIIDLGTPEAPNLAPTWTTIGPRSVSARNRRRLHLNAVVLPTAEVFVCGGVVLNRNDNTAVLDTEMLVRDPSGQWKWSPERLARSAVPRNYHSTALLMPDGRVWTAGSSKRGLGGGREKRELRVEIYEPWYWFRERPIIRTWPQSVAPGQSVRVEVESSRRIDRLAILRCGSVTHAFDSDQRYIGLADLAHNGNFHTAVVPANGIVIGGWYLLFALTDENVPSKGKFIRVA